MYDWWNPRKFSADTQIADGNLFAVIPGDASFHLIAEAANGKIGNDFAEKEQRTGAAVTKVDSLVGASPQAGTLKSWKRIPDFQMETGAVLFGHVFLRHCLRSGQTRNR
jgi:hypothetical protein